MIGLEDRLVGDKLLRFAQIAALKDKQDWAAMCSQLDDEIEVKLKKMQSDLLHTTAFNQRDVDFLRGWWTAARFVKNMPANADRQYKVLKAKEKGQSLSG